MDNKETVDQSVLAQDVANKIPYEFVDFFLVKPLDPIKVKKEFSNPVSNNAPTKDENDVEAVDYDKVETEIKEVDSDYRRGIVLKVPFSHEVAMSDEKVVGYAKHIKIGDIVLFREMSKITFDLLKDSRLIRYYDIVAIENVNN